ncbi:SDR family NAD(P)-dependent oxidoreductase [Sphingorhabdus arenilitoris]|uniref:SDR family NAD(P)-dependent oxidoreductase n=1 Tax=Sphingorhabdus arenilitoris TaxID=1490041 RepID=A0ABV8RFN6_9SPHN
METLTKAAVVIGSSGGIGAAFVRQLQASGAYDEVIGLNRANGFDLTDEASIAQAAAVLKGRSLEPDMVIVASGVLHRGDRGPEKSLRELDVGWMTENYKINAIGPALVAKHFLPLMPRKQRGVFAALSARVGSISDNRLGGWHGYRASKAALNMLIRNLSIEWQRKTPEAIITALHPGTVQTPLSEPFGGGHNAPDRFTPDDSASRMLQVLNSLSAEQSGRIFAYDGQEIMP